MGLVSIFRKHIQHIQKEEDKKKGPSPKFILLVQVGEDMSNGLL